MNLQRIVRFDFIANCLTRILIRALEEAFAADPEFAR